MTIPARFGLVYAALFAGVGIFYAYMALYLKAAGLTGTQIGIILAVLPLAGFMTQPLWGLLSDIYQVRRSMLAAACFALAIIACLYVVSDSFVWLLSCTIALAIVRSPVGPLCDALALEYLETMSRRRDYGRLRLWGSIGYAVAALATGAFVIGYSLQLILYLFSATMVIMGIVSLALPDAPRSDIRPTLRDGRVVLVANPILVKVLLGALLVGATLGVVNSYQIVYLAGINAPGWVSGLAFAISGLMEAGLMGVAAPLIHRWGLRAVLIGGIALLPLRWLLYTVITDPILVLPTQLLHSAAMLSLLVAAVLFVDEHLDSRWRATGQTLYQASLHGVGSAIGLVGAGVIYERAGITEVWAICAVVGTLGLAAMIWATWTPIAKRLETTGV
jgi:PPP family 3-phenylpropionic acid transporter